MNFNYSTPNDKAPGANPPTFLKLVLASVTIIVVIMVVWSIVMLSGRSGDAAPIELRVLPEHAQVWANDKQITNSDSLAPGTYSIRASADGFEQYKGTFTVGDSLDKQVLAISLLPESEEAQNYARENQELYTEQERYGATQAQQQSSIFFEKNPIAKKLPYSNLVYTIGYSRANPNDPSDQSIVIEISAPTGYRNAAVDHIRELGFNPADFTINFENYVNPFKP